MSEWISGNRFLNMPEMQNNALKVRDHLADMGWTDNAIAAVLGNMQTESSINPGIWENLQPFWRGYGLVQWTPYTKYTEWAGVNYASGDRQLERIDYEAENGIQWFYNAQVQMSPPITFREFTHSLLDIETLSDYWLYFYEHPGDPLQSRTLRRQQTTYWYEYITGHPYTPTENGDILLLLARRKGRKQVWRIS